MLLVSLLFIQCFSVHFVWEFPSTMPVFRDECDITDRSFPGVWWAGGGPSTARYFYFLGGRRVEGESHTPAKIKWLQESGSGAVTREAEMGRMLALSPDTRDNTELICISHHSLRSPNNLCYLGIANRIVFCICTLPGRDVFWSRTSTKEWKQVLPKQASLSFLPGHLPALPLALQVCLYAVGSR